MAGPIRRTPASNRPIRRPPGAPPLVFTRAQVRDVDRIAVERYGIPSILLMENAAVALLRVARRMLSRRRADRTVVLCGPGNNGGDGLALARHLHNSGVRVRVLLAAERREYAGDAATNLSVAERMGLDISDAAGGGAGTSPARLMSPRPGRVLLVDALLGTGLDRPVTGPMLAMIRAINAGAAAGAGVLAVDIPSGLDCDSGAPLGDAVRADVTVSFVGLKAGFLRPAARPYLGRVVVADIGAPRELAASLGSPRSRSGRVGRNRAHGHG